MKYYGAIVLFIGLTSVCSADQSKIKITSTEAFAMIYVDGQKAGMIDSTNTATVNVSPGEHNVQLIKKDKEGGVLVNKTIDIFIPDGALQEYNFAKVKNDATKRISHYTVDLGVGTVTDRNTGLMWKQCSEGLSGSGCQKGEEVRGYNWYQARTLNNSRFAGYSDWRLPTIEELHTLIYCSNGTPPSEVRYMGPGFTCRSKNNLDAKVNYQRPTINQTAFPNSQYSFYWSSSTFAKNNSNAWVVNFFSGNDEPITKDDYAYVRLVRGGQ